MSMAWEFAELNEAVRSYAATSRATSDADESLALLGELHRCFRGVTRSDSEALVEFIRFVTSGTCDFCEEGYPPLLEVQQRHRELLFYLDAWGAGKLSPPPEREYVDNVYTINRPRKEVRSLPGQEGHE